MAAVPVPCIEIAALIASCERQTENHSKHEGKCDSLSLHDREQFMNAELIDNIMCARIGRITALSDAIGHKSLYGNATSLYHSHYWVTPLLAQLAYWRSSLQQHFRRAAGTILDRMS